jgi:Ca2+-binding EF-hand superfamily protein
MLESIFRKVLVSVLAVGLLCQNSCFKLASPSLDFDNIDKNHDGSITVDELRLNWKERLAADESGRRKVLLNITRGADVLTPERAAAEDLGSDFQKMDKNGDHVVTFAEVEEYVANEMATSQIWRHDENEDGVLSRNEYSPAI